MPGLSPAPEKLPPRRGVRAMRNRARCFAQLSAKLRLPRYTSMRVSAGGTGGKDLDTGWRSWREMYRQASEVHSSVYIVDRR